MVTLTVLAVCLFILGLLFGRRFGVITLALAAGLVISQNLAVTLSLAAAPYVRQYVSYVPPALVLLPALFLLLFSKGRHRRLPARVVHAALFAAAGVVMVVVAPGTPVSISSGVPFITAHAGIIVTALLGLAILEVAFGKPSKKKVEEPSKH